MTLGHAALAGLYPHLNGQKGLKGDPHIDPRYGMPMEHIPKVGLAGDGWGQCAGPTTVEFDRSLKTKPICAAGEDSGIPEGDGWKKNGTTQ